MQELADISTTIVIRDGEAKTISSEELLVGDVIKIEQGKVVPADCILIESKHIVCNESSLTGEADSMLKEALTVENEQYNPCPFLM